MDLTLSPEELTTAISALKVYANEMKRMALVCGERESLVEHYEREASRAEQMSLALAWTREVMK